MYIRVPDTDEILNVLGHGAKHFFYFVFIVPSLYLFFVAPLMYQEQTVQADCPVRYGHRVRGEFVTTPMVFPKGTKVLVHYLSFRTDDGSPGILRGLSTHRLRSVEDLANKERQPAHRKLNPGSKLPTYVEAFQSDLTGVCGLSLPLFGIL